MITCHAVERPGTGIHVRRNEDGRIVGACGEGEDQDGANAAFERGVAALASSTRRAPGSVTVPRAHVERLEDGSEVKLGVFLSNSKTRRAKLTTDKLGPEWAV